MSQKTDPSGNNSIYHYNTDGTLHDTVDSNGITKSLEYDAANSTTTVTEKDGGVWTHKYYAEFNVPLEITDPLGNKTTYSYDYSKNQLLSITYPDTTSISFEYDPNTGNLLSQTDRRGKITTFAYDSDPQKGGLGIRVTEIVDPAQKTTHITYDANGNIHTITDRTNATTTFLRADAKKNITGIIDPLTHPFQYDYHDQSSNLGNQVMSVTDPTSRTINFTRNKLGSILTVTDALDHTTSFAYDNSGELVTSITDHLTNSTVFGYDPNGNINSVTDPVGNPPTGYTYNYRGQLTKITDAHGEETIFSYTTTGCFSCNGGGEKLTSVEDPAHSITNFTYGYDLENKLYVTTMTDPLQKTVISTYDPRTRQQVVTDRKGDQITYAYTATGKLASITYPDPNHPQVISTYNDLDRLTDTQDSVGTTHYVYDDEGRVTDYTDANGYALHFVYYPTGSLQQIIYPDSGRVTYTYDAANRLEHVRNWLRDTVYEEATYTYDAAGRLQTFTQFNGIQTAYTFDAADRLTDTVSAVAEYHFTLDANGNRVQSQQTEPLAALPPAGAGMIDFVYNDGKNRLLSAGNINYGYDFEGQLSSAGATSLTFDYDHRLVGIGSDMEFFYDGQGNRLKAVSPDYSS